MCMDRTGRGGAGATETKRPRARERWRRHVEPRVRPSRSGPTYAQRVLNSDPFTHPMLTIRRDRCIANSTLLLPLPPLNKRTGGRRWRRGRGAHTYIRTTLAPPLSRCIHTKLTRASSNVRCTGWGPRWQQCVTDRPAYDRNQGHTPPYTTLYTG